MPHGLPDWWGAAPKSTTYGLQDMAELAVRLGGISSFDRRGDIIFMEDFSSGTARVYTSGSGTGYDAYPSTDAPLSGGVHLMLQAGNAANNLAWLTKEMVYPVLGRVGLECAFVARSDQMYFKTRIFEYVSIERAEYSVRYAVQTGKLEILQSNGTYAVLGTPGLTYLGYNDYNVMKMVVGILNGRYVRVLFNDHTYIADAYQPYVTGGIYRKCMAADVEVTANDANSMPVPVDNFIVTQNEPA